MSDQKGLEELRLAEAACQWATEHARSLAASADEELEDRLTALIESERGEVVRRPLRAASEIVVPSAGVIGYIFRAGKKHSDGQYWGGACGWLPTQGWAIRYATQRSARRDFRGVRIAHRLVLLVRKAKPEP